MRFYREHNANPPRDLGYCLASHIELLVTEGQGPGALAAAREALAMAGVAEDARLRATLENGLIVALAVTGDLAGAGAIVDAGAPAGVGLEVSVARQIIGGLVALARGDAAKAGAIAAEVIRRIEQTGAELCRPPATRLAVAAAQAAPVPVERLPQLLWGVANP